MEVRGFAMSRNEDAGMLISDWLNGSKRQRQRRRRQNCRTELLEQRVLLTFPAFSEVAAADNPFNGIDLEIRQAAPAFVDLDDDGDFDLVVGHIGGRFRFLENVGTRSEPEFAERILSDNPLSGLLLEGIDATPTFGDLDGDGDADLVSRSSLETRFIENTGTATAAAFALRQGVESPLDGITSGRLVALGDIDGDGDLDLVGGGFISGGLRFIENTGTESDAVFVKRTGDDNPFLGIDVGYYPAPVMGDLDGDGDIDLLLGKGMAL
jgi:hypothetical protein